jgi:pimeloyl-ACP methyl ester carboxylesterase
LDYIARAYADGKGNAMQAQTGFAEVNGTRLYYEVAGSGHPLVLIHGMSLDTRMWDDQFEPLAQHYRVVRYDARGFGKSALPTGESYAHTDDLKALLEYLDIAHAFILGLSMGGGIAIDFALAHPEATDALTLVDSRLTGWQPDSEFAAFLSAVRLRAKEAGVQAARDVWLYSPMFNPALENPRVAARLVQIVADYSGWHWVNENPLRTLHPRALQRLDTIRVPTLILIGERDVPDCQAIAETLHQRIPKARKVMLPQVGHMSNMETPERFNALLLDFLTEQQ